MYSLALTNYFSKWAKVVTLKEVKKKNAIDFIRIHIIYQNGVPWYIIRDNDKLFFNKQMTSFYKRFKFAQHKSSMYNKPTNGLAEAFNKTLCNLLKKVLSKSKLNWLEKLG